jgi:hypothetical protein
LCFTSISLRGREGQTEVHPSIPVDPYLGELAYG